MQSLSHPRSPLLALCAMAALLLPAAAGAASPVSPAQQRYQQERAACLSGNTNQERATCLREAAAALQESRRGGLSTVDEGQLARNQRIRCEALPTPDRDDCVRRMQGEGAASGSAQQGGIMRELTSPVPAR